MRLDDDVVQRFLGLEEFVDLEMRQVSGAFRFDMD